VNDSDSSYGVSQLGDNSITMTYGLVLIIALVALIFLRLVFADVSVSARGGA
jgi:hypothetical protein